MTLIALHYSTRFYISTLPPRSNRILFQTNAHLSLAKISHFYLLTKNSQLFQPYTQSIQTIYNPSQCAPRRHELAFVHTRRRICRAAASQSGASLVAEDVRPRGCSQSALTNQFAAFPNASPTRWPTKHKANCRRLRYKNQHNNYSRNRDAFIKQNS